MLFRRLIDAVKNYRMNFYHLIFYKKFKYYFSFCMFKVIYFPKYYFICLPTEHFLNRTLVEQKSRSEKLSTYNLKFEFLREIIKKIRFFISNIWRKYNSIHYCQYIICMACSRQVDTVYHTREVLLLIYSMVLGRSIWKDNNDMENSWS